MADDPWAEFRTPAPAASPSPPADRGVVSATDPWGDFRVAAAAPVAVEKPAAAPRYDAAGDVGGGIVTGLVNGVTGFLGIPGLIQQADGYLGGKALDALGFQNAAEKVRNLPFLPTPDSLTGHVEKVTGPLYKPETVPGQYARTVAEFVPGAAIGPGGVVRKVAETVVPAVLSETAGQATKGTEAEPYARLMAAIAGNVGTAAVAARADAPARAIGTAASRVTPAQFDQAEALAQTGQRVGVPLTGPEALQHATNNGTKLADVQRFVEGSPQSAVLSEMMAARPGQVEAATGRTLDTIAPQSAEPSTLGPLAADAARRSIANSPEGQALAESVRQVGPRTTPAQAGPVIQDGLHDVYRGREGMRAALADQDYAAANNAPQGIGIERMIEVERPGDPIITHPAYSRPQFTDAAPLPLDGITKADPANAGAEPESLARFIARNGGLALDGDLRSQDIHRFNIPGAGNVAREGGKPLDSFWREHLIEHGYLKPDADGGMARDIRGELMRKLTNERRGVPSYPIGAEPVAVGRGANGRMADEHATAVSLADSRFREDLGRAGINYDTVHPDIHSRVLGALVRGEHVDPLDAYERTVGAMQGPLQPYVKSTTVREEIPDVRFGQANPSAVVEHIDDALRTAKGPVAKALNAARNTLWTRSGPGQARELDLSVEGLQGARAAMGDLISQAEPTTQRVLIGVRDRLDQALAAVPEHAEATRNFAAASVPLRPFENSALAKVIERDEFGRSFILPAERSAPTIEAGGPTAVRTFNTVAPPEARAGFENYLGTKLLDAATDARGTVSGDALALGIRDRSDVLDTVPGLQRRLQGVRAADEALAPQRQGAIGDLSRVATTEAAGNMVLPSKPRVGGERELVDLIMRTAREEPHGTAQLVRQRLADQADTSMGRLVGGEAQGGGAKFAKDIAGTRQQATNLDAVLRALPVSPAAPAAVDDLMQILRATGTRKPQGSATSFNDQYKAEIGGDSLPQQAMTALKTQGRSLLANVGDASKRAYLGRNNAALADILSAPDSVQQIRAIAARRAETPFADAFMRMAVQAPAAGRTR